MVHVARANAGLTKLADTQGEKAPSSSLLKRVRRLARFLPFHRIYHSVELTMVIFVAALVGLVVGEPLVDRVLLIVLVPVSYTHLRAHETDSYLVCRLLLE